MYVGEVEYVGHGLRDKESHVFLVGRRVKEGLRVFSRQFCERERRLTSEGFISYVDSEGCVRFGYEGSDKPAYRYLFDASDNGSSCMSHILFDATPFKVVVADWSKI